MCFQIISGEARNYDYVNCRLPETVRETWRTYGSNCNCNLFAVHKSKLGYSPVDIDFVTYMPSNIIYLVVLVEIYF